MTAIICRIVEVCVFRFAHDRPEYLVLQRAADEPLHPGIWQMVTGTIDGDEKASETAIRELKEETRLRPDRFWAAPHVSTFYDVALDAVNVSPLFAAQVGPGEEPVLSSEHQRHEWLPYRQAAQRLIWPGQRQGLAIVHEYLLGGEEAGRRTMLPLR